MKNILPFLLILLICSCKKKENKYDASGSFEADEIIVSAEASGQILQLNVEEGMQLYKDSVVGIIDTVQLYLKKKQLLSQQSAVLSKRPEVSSQLIALQAQLQAAKKDQQRYVNLVKADAVPQKKLDDINTQIDVINGQIEALQSSLGITSSSITKEAQPLSIQVEQLNDQLKKSYILNPVKGTVLVKYAEQGEVAAVGKPLYKIADLSSLNLRAYITGNQLGNIKLQQQVKVSVDSADDHYRVYQGTIIYISDKAEFTPKTIQTKEERANKVYAIKIRVVNDGYLKIGMYGEINF
jgi:HlyD family secretion protein